MTAKRLLITLLIVSFSLGALVAPHGDIRAQEPAVRVIPFSGRLFESRLSPDGKTLAVIENSNVYAYWAVPDVYVPIRLLNLDTGAITLLKGPDFAFDVAWSADSARLFSLHGTGWLVEWDVATATEITRVSIAMGQSLISALPDGHSVVWRASGNVSQFGIWDLDTGHMTAYLTRHTATYADFMNQVQGSLPDYTATFALSPDGTMLAEATLYGRIWLWDVANGIATLLRDTQETAPMLPIFDLSFTADGANLIYLDRQANAILSMDLATATETPLVEPGPALNPALSPDGSRLAWLAADANAIIVWSAAQPDNPQTIPLPMDTLPDGIGVGRVYRGAPLHFTPDGTQLICAGLMNLDTGENAILVIDLAQ